MNLAAAEIDQIVAEVVRRLAAVSSPAGSPPSAVAPGTLTLGLPVITLDSLMGLAGANTLVVPAKAVVTPAVRDELKKRGVNLVRAEHNAFTPSTAVRLLLALADGATLSPTGLKELPGVERIESHGSSSLSSLIAELRKHAAQRRLPALLVAQRAFAAVSEIARQGCSAVAQVSTAADVAQAHAEIAPAIFVVAAGKTPPSALRSIVQAILALPAIPIHHPPVVR